MADHDGPNDWPSISLALFKEPHDFLLWQNLIYAAEYQTGALLDVTASPSQRDLLDQSYESFLRKYPLLSKYWVAFATWKRKLVDTNAADAVFHRGLLYVSLDVHYWVEYLTFKVETISDNIREILMLFEAAREKIGLHYHAYDFYSLYIRFLRTYATSENKFVEKLALLLRLTMEVPLYDFSGLFREIFAFVEPQNQSFLHLKCFVGEESLKKLRKECNNNGKLIHKRLHKLVSDSYTVSQYKSYELFKFEKELPSPTSWTVDLIPANKRANWNNYLEFVEFNYPCTYVIQLYERCVCLNPSADFFHKYVDYLISQKKLALARGILQRGILLDVVKDSVSLLLRLVDLELYSGRISRARDLVASFIMCNKSVSVRIYDKLLEIEAFVSRNDGEHICRVAKEIVSATKLKSYFYKIRRFEISKESLASFYILFAKESILKELGLADCKAYWTGLRETATKEQLAGIEIPQNFTS